ncbi:hypothetical protein CIG75_12705 [Tumebacillus algifaecis]|uniref:DUF4376 domain-containing protein n=1 Tax=Tumebacillus algifaecis TaxID=1214604 RepID=A0A223D224_9BACL|nr:hypothetical protein [Tumebacillus algifaecis]ASS75759.1 hypothetical protein CIG75_12705 [Tumebacillus algifaecis]
MEYIEFELINEEKAKVTLQHSKPELLSEKDSAKGLFVESVPPMPVNIEKYKIPMLYVNPATQELWWESEARPLTDQERIEQLAEQLKAEQARNKSADQRYRDLNPATVPLDQLKQSKSDQLNEACEAAILRGFTSSATGHFYAFGVHDQTNFTQQMLLLLADPSAEKVTWKTEDVGVIVHTREQFLAICAEAEQHKRAQIGRYWQLKVDLATSATWQEVDSNKWN